MTPELLNYVIFALITKMSNLLSLHVFCTTKRSGPQCCKNELATKHLVNTVLSDAGRCLTHISVHCQMAAVRTDAAHGRHLLKAVATSGSSSRSDGGGTARSSSSAVSTGGVATSFAAADSKVSHSFSGNIC